MSKIKQLKSELKQEAILIRKVKAAFKDAQRINNGTFYPTYNAWAKENKIGAERKNWRGENSFYIDYPSDLSARYRLRHIAYCMLRGKTYEQIEPKVKDGNHPDTQVIESIMREYREVEEIQCAEVINV